ncbi:transporter substrate-binding domain-containing protein [Duganella sp. FT92W]|uniref:Transporter substrate-binding domain-containing protein n=1 Tax=Pseudoduganella rivuli TaxID=2666085 RepID=A0A7X2ILZ5_9BURK|nr:transporter substrate-binding domain-containing protein [Pseudoduganella rivuli]MRV72320.1 transporter substrate-binding domain-containing protein [Pseudoduganella rivuli]
MPNAKPGRLPTAPAAMLLSLTLSVPCAPCAAQSSLGPPPGIPATVHLARGVDDPIIDFSSAMVREAYARLGITATDEVPSGERVLKALNAGEFFGDIVHIEGFDRMYPNLVRIPVPLITYYAMAVTDGRLLPIKTWADLSPYRVCIKRGVKSIDMMTKSLPHRIVAAEYAPLFRMLRVGRCEVAVVPQSAWLQPERFEMKGMRTLEPPLQSWPLYHHVHKSNSAIVPLLQRVLQDMAKSGYLEQQRAQYQQRLEKSQREAGITGR